MASNSSRLLIFNSPTPSLFSSQSSQIPSSTPLTGVSTLFSTLPSSTFLLSTPPSSFGTSTQTLVDSSPVAIVTEHTVTAAQSAAGGSSTFGPETIFVTSTASVDAAPAPSATHTVTPSAASSKTTSSPALATAGSSSSGSGLSAPGKIAVAVVVPVVAVALIVLAALFLWRRRKQKKDAEELRRKEVEEYGFNPNHDPTLPVIGGASTNGDDPSQMTEMDGSGYRGWGTTSNPRKASTTLSSGNGPIGVARSTSGSDNGRFGNGSPTGATNKSSDVQSNDPLVGSPPNGRPLTGDSETIGALGAMHSAGHQQQQQNMHRGPSNASSAYSGAHQSDTSGEGNMPNGSGGQQYFTDGMYFDEGMPQHGPYGDGSYGGGQPVIRDVPARRNTRIENPSIIPQQGSAGIAQNF